MMQKITIYVCNLTYLFIRFQVLEVRDKRIMDLQIPIWKEYAKAESVTDTQVSL